MPSAGPDVPVDVPIVHLVGPGGAGKSSTGAILARLLGWRFVDLDLVFLERNGDIGAFIDGHGYAGYARRNVQLYSEIRATAGSPAVMATSSGFMTYPLTIEGAYAGIRTAIEHDPRTVLLLPDLDVDACVEVLVPRQLARPYLEGGRAKEEQRVRTRHPLFLKLQCARCVGVEPVEVVASRIADALRPVLGGACDPRVRDAGG